MGQPDDKPLCWGSRVSPSFRDCVRRIGDRLQIDPDFLMACIAFETGRTFDPAIRNAAGSGAVGLIQFMPSTAAALGTSTEALERMTGPEQLNYVFNYFEPHRAQLHTLSDVYMAILWPGAIGKPEGWVLFDQADKAHPKLYLQNRGLDFNQDGKITKAEAAAGPARQLDAGLRPGNAA